MTEQFLDCKICRSKAYFLGIKRGDWRPLNYEVYSCPFCKYSFVSNPSTDYDQIYTLDYYNGKGAAPNADYFNELRNPQRVIRQYEWRGIFKIVSHLKPLSSESTWLDFGCGNGGLVRWVKSYHDCHIVGFEEGEISDFARSKKIPVLTAEQIESQFNFYDVITAIEVIEHIENPLGVLKQIYDLLKPGGIFFYTTGNAQKQRSHLLKWSYVVPEVHISFYEPETMETAMSSVGFKVKKIGYLPGFEDVIRFKVLKNLGFKNTALWEKLLPWSILSPIVNRRFGVSAFPIGIKS